MWFVAAVVIGLCYLLEFVRPVVARPSIVSWVWRVWGLNVLQVAALVLGVVAWRSMIDDRSLLRLSTHLSSVGAGVLGYVVYTFVFYWWHRARHASDGLWRVLHQIHHSPRRLELVTAFYKHPLETVANVLLGGVLMFWLLGLDAGAAAVCTLLAGAADVVYHANVRTPRWVGWFVQRPEMHRLHHEVDQHRGNYGDLPVWDALFGTLRLPSEEPVACGFTAGREERLLAMLAGVDVHDGLAEDVSS